jgi:hypothetical protein
MVRRIPSELSKLSSTDDTHDTHETIDATHTIQNAGYGVAHFTPRPDSIGYQPT